MEIYFSAVFTEQLDPGQLRVPRAKTFPDLVLHPLGHFQLAQNQQSSTRQHIQNIPFPQNIGLQEITSDYSDLVYEYPEYDSDEYYTDEENETDSTSIKFEREPVISRPDKSRFILFY